MGIAGVKVERKRYDTTKLREGVCRVGFFSNSRYDDGLSVAQVARWNEYGVGVPLRPFMRPALHENKQALVDILRSKYKKALKDNENTMKVLGQFGEYCKGLVQDQINNTWEPANAKITIEGGWMRNKKTGKPIYLEGKGFNAPLRNTKVMLHSVSHQEEEIRK